MDRHVPEIGTTPAEPTVRLPLDLDDDPADESIYGTSYRARAGVVVADPRPAAEPRPVVTRR